MYSNKLAYLPMGNMMPNFLIKSLKSIKRFRRTKSYDVLAFKTPKLESIDSNYIPSCIFTYNALLKWYQIPFREWYCVVFLYSFIIFCLKNKNKNIYIFFKQNIIKLDKKRRWSSTTLPQGTRNFRSFKLSTFLFVVLSTALSCEVRIGNIFNGLIYITQVESNSIRHLNIHLSIRVSLV